MDPRVYFHSDRKQRHNNPSLRSQLVQDSMLNFIGGPLKVKPKRSYSNHHNYQSNSYQTNNQTKYKIAGQNNRVNQQQKQRQSEHNSKNNRPNLLQQYASLLLSQHQTELAKSMLKRSVDSNDYAGIKMGFKTNSNNLQLSDRDRYYYQRTKILTKYELIDRNSNKQFITKQPISHDKIYGKHSISPHNQKQPYVGYTNFSPKLLTNADQVKNVIFGV